MRRDTSRSAAFTLALLAAACAGSPNSDATDVNAATAEEPGDAMGGAEETSPAASLEAPSSSSGEPEAPGATTEPQATAPAIPVEPPEIELPVGENPELACAATVAGTEQSQALLQPFVMLHQDVARRTLFSWTVPEQIEELKADPTLLTRSMSTNGERGRSADLILEAAATDPMAALLAEPRFEKRRFAWSNPWATLLGFTGEDYGDRLLAITLKQEAYIGRLIASGSGLSWAFFDTSGAPVSNEQVLAAPERIAAVYFADLRDPAACGGSIFRSGSVFREYFLCNESMIESWSAYTTELEAEVARGVEALQALHSALDNRSCDSVGQTPACWRERVVQSWELPVDAGSANLVGLYEQSLAFPSDLYLTTASNIAGLLTRLGEVPFDEEPLVHEY
jgi:hypothetical protein